VNLTYVRLGRGNRILCNKKCCHCQLKAEAEVLLFLTHRFQRTRLFSTQVSRTLKMTNFGVLNWIIKLNLSKRLDLEFLFCFRPSSKCRDPLKEKLTCIFLGRGFPSAFNWIASAEDSPFKKTRLFGLENTHHVVDNIYFCELGCEQSYSSIDSELWAVTPAINSWAVNNINPA